jgi:predicted AlkP superfamily phosphohydrolase/phosphomutase
MVIGLDGATWTLLDRLIAEGVMPNLGRLKAEGTHGPLWSVVPPMTATAWTSFQTGKGPGRHGIYDWTEPVPGTYLYRPIDSTRIQSRTLFELLSERGARVASVNLPLTYPARPVNGVAVGDMLTPGKDAPGFTHPAAFVDELARVVPDYRIDTHLTDGEEDLPAFLGRLRGMIRGKAALNAHLLAREPWDLYCCVWVEMDRMQHCVWHILDDRHPAHDARLAALHRDAILDVYRELDVQVQAMVDARPEGCNVVFLSDHGFGPCRYKVFLNTWLAQEGFLAFKPREGAHGTRARLNRARRVLDRAGIDTRTILAWARRVGGDTALRFGGEHLSRFAAEIDWERTQAFCHGTNAIRLNLRGREPGGSVDPADAPAVLARLRERLIALRDPEGQRVVTGVQTREALYAGPEVPLAADLLVTHHDDSVWFYYSEGDVPERIFEPSGWASGNHEPDGLFLGWGPDFRSGGRIEDANIVDILPTIFATMGVPVPDDVDGRVLHEVLTQRVPVRWTEAQAYRPSRAGVERTAATDRAIEERLRGLGYLQ